MQPQQPLVWFFHYLKIGVSHTDRVGLSHTATLGVTQTVF